MGVQVDNYCTTSFILKDDQAVEYISRLCKLVENESNLTSGYLSDGYCSFIRYGKEERSFIIKTGGFCDSGPQLRYSAVYPKPESEEELEDEDESDWEDEDSIDLFEEVRANLKEGTWFFVDGYSWDKSGAYTSVQFLHQNGKSEWVTNFDIKKEILKKMNI
jgi:hypothetical protein